jgi:hypothetical protein
MTAQSKRAGLAFRSGSLVTKNTLDCGLCLTYLLLVPFVRIKWIKGNQYCYLVMGEKVDGRVKQRVLLYLGRHKSVAAAYKYWLSQRDKKGMKTQAAKMIRKLKPFL